MKNHALELLARELLCNGKMYGSELSAVTGFVELKDLAPASACRECGADALDQRALVRARVSADGLTWTAWEGPYANPAGSTIRLADNRYIQYKAKFASENNTLMPELRWVRITYT